jgi:hypothetical protein
MKKLLIVVCLVSSINLLGLSESHLDGLVTHAEHLVKSANSVSGNDQKMKLLREAKSAMSVLTSYGRDLEDKHSKWLQVLHNHGESVDKFNSEESAVAGKISSLNTEVSNSMVKLDYARKVESAAKKGQVYATPAVKRAQQAERAKRYAVSSSRASRRRQQDLKEMNNSHNNEAIIASSALHQLSWPVGSSKTTAASQRRKSANRTLNSKIANDSKRFKESLSDRF